MPESPANPADPIAFRRLQESLERHAAVFMELCTGDAVAGDRAVADAMRTQSEDARATGRALAVRFWRSLLAAADLRTGATPALTGPLARLGELSPGLRALVLLKGLSNLGEVELAALLGRSPASCRQGLAKAEQLLGSDAWAALPVLLDARVAGLAPARLVNIASRRSVPITSPRWESAAPRVMSPGRRRALGAVVLGTTLALLATYWWPGHGLEGDDTPRIRTRPLAESKPQSRFDADLAIATHPDRALLEIAEGDAAIARETAFYAWYQAERLGTSTYEPPPPTFEAPEGVSSSTDTGGQDAP